jgi:AraC-like DNA-binding protein
LSWSDIAATVGYSDQPRLAREFQAWAGISPTVWANEQNGDAGFVQDGNVTVM